MPDIKLFSLLNGVKELPSTSVSLEKELQTLIEQNMELFFGVTFLKSEHIITNGRIDSLGLDENYCPVILEYKRSSNENVINQGLFYLDWLLDHKADFKLLVMNTLGDETAEKIDWSLPCVICIASDFTKFDEHAVNQMQRNIKLVRYKKYDKDFMLFEHINAPNVKPITENQGKSNGQNSVQKTFEQNYSLASKKFQDIYESIRDYILSLGDDITENQLKLYVAFKKVRNIVCVEIYKSKIIMHVSISPDSIELQNGFTRDMTATGHYGTGNVQITIKNIEDFEKAKPIILQAYNEG